MCSILVIMTLRMQSLVVLLCLIAPCSCCCNRRNNKNDYPKPELLFPGLSEWSARSSSSDASSFLESVTSAIAGFVPGGQFLSSIGDGIKYMKSVLSGAENAFENFVEKNIAVAAIADVKAKLVTVENRMKEAEQKMFKGSNSDVPLHIAWDKCEEILQKFSYEWGPLYKSGNTLVSAPSLVSFTRVYPGMALIGFKLWPEKRQHILEEMDLLLGTLKKYQASAMSKRMSYVRTFAFFKSTCNQGCEDKYYKIISCSSCYKVECDGGFLFRPSYSIDLFNDYENELRNKYNEYFNDPVQKLEEFIRQLRLSLNSR